MLIKTSQSNTIPDWVDREVWGDYVRENSKLYSNPLSRLVRYLSDAVMEPVFKPDVLSWNDVEELITNLGESIREEYQPNLLIGIEKGGALYIARLAEELDIDPKDPEKVAKMKISHYNGLIGNNAFTQWVQMIKGARVGETPKIALEGRDCLLADDDIATGKTIIVGKNYLFLEGANKVKGAVLYSNGSKEADFFASPKSYGKYPWYQLGK